ncbi:PREDICTED: uncharacterized protein LOC105113844 [Populus euphratica]|uniref:Uncharacterized protein LOC105113844 n=1 Tax=Populus euphratica TaxID=75702 RepID=A0AAJ6X7Q8_POPEU|nr:PREDICTED: uncharacterized protein LOC105113844 [Populus euphratica]
MDITGTDLAASILFTSQSLILAELGLKLGVKSAFVLCIFHILLCEEKQVKMETQSRCREVVFRTSPVTFCKTIRATANCLRGDSTSFSWLSASPLPWLRNGNRSTRSSRNCSPEQPIYK